jgi:diadenosine tetraphosphate (Ap4A) HIT family hydrolase
VPRWATPKQTRDCTLCRPDQADSEFGRVEVWSDDLWRLTTSVGPNEPLAGFSYLEPRRHIPYLSDLDGQEAATFGPVLARVTAALKQATGAELVYVYVFGGGIPHLHIHLAPHHEGDALNSQMIRGEVIAQKLPSGATAMVSKDFPSIPEDELQHVVERLSGILAS